MQQQVCTFEQYKDMNGNNYRGAFDKWAEEIDRRNYDIVRKTVDAFYAHYDMNADKPQEGDLVEYSDGYEVYKHALIDRIYDHGVVQICEQGSTHISYDKDHTYLSTSGGSFPCIHISKFVPNGDDVRMAWCWNWKGAGAGNGINFSFRVRKWLIPHGEVQPRQRIYFGRSKDSHDFVRITDICWRYPNDDMWFFKSFRAFRAWADYVGFTYDHNISEFGYGMGKPINFFLHRKYIRSENELPTGAKELVSIQGGRAMRSWVCNDGKTITRYVINDDKYRLDSDKQDGFKVYCKYDGDPLGVDTENN